MQCVQLYTYILLLPCRVSCVPFEKILFLRAVENQTNSHVSGVYSMVKFPLTKICFPQLCQSGKPTQWWLQAIPPNFQGPQWSICQETQNSISKFLFLINFNSTAPFKNAFLVPDLARRPFGGDFQQVMVVGSFRVGKLDCCRRITMLVGSLPCWKASLL